MRKAKARRVRRAFCLLCSCFCAAAVGKVAAAA